MVTKREKELLLRIGALIRGNWSGIPFDGRDVLEWIEMVVDGDFDKLDKELKPFEETEGLWVE